MNNLDSSTLQAIVTDALERTAFVVADPIDGIDADEGVSNFAFVAFSGPINGKVIVGASEGFLRELASSLLGVEPDEVDPDAEGDDALRELANIIGGSVVTAFGGEINNFSLGLPERTDTDSVPDDGAALQCVFDSEGEALSVKVWPVAQSGAQAA